MTDCYCIPPQEKSKTAVSRQKKSTPLEAPAIRIVEAHSLPQPKDYAGRLAAVYEIIAQCVHRSHEAQAA